MMRAGLILHFPINYFFFDCRARFPSGFRLDAFSIAIPSQPPAFSPASIIASTINVMGIKRTSCVRRAAFCATINSWAVFGILTRQSFPVFSMRAKVWCLQFICKTFFTKICAVKLRLILFALKLRGKPCPARPPTPARRAFACTAP